MYIGKIINDEAEGLKDVDRIVSRDGVIIDPAVSLKVMNHSPDGFSWGYPGSGPAQLALGILLVHLKGDKERALSLYHDFKFKVISKLPMDDDFTLTDAQVETAISEIDLTRMKNS